MRCGLFRGNYSPDPKDLNPAALLPHAPMHIVFAIWNANTAGAVLNASRMQAEYLADKGHAVTLVSDRLPGNWRGIREEQTEALNSGFWRVVDFALVGACRRFLHGAFRRRWDMYRVLPQALFPHSAARRIVEIHRRTPVHLCVCCQHYCGFGLGRVRRATRIPFLLVSHGDIFDHPANAFSIPMTLLYRRAAVTSYRSANHIIAVSTRMRDRAIQCGAKAEDVTVIPNGIDIDEITNHGPAEVDPSRKTKVEILFVGRLAPEKGPDVLLRAATDLNDIPFRLRMIGNGPMEKSLRDMSNELGINDRCEFLGKINRRDLGHFYRNSDLLVVPSFADAQSVVTLEALVCGIPVIASNIGGIPDVVQDGRNGLLVPPGDPKALAAAVRRACIDKKLRDNAQQLAKTTASRFAWSKTLRQFHETILSTQNGNKTRSTTPHRER